MRPIFVADTATLDGVRGLATNPNSIRAQSAAWAGVVLPGRSRELRCLIVTEPDFVQRTRWSYDAGAADYAEWIRDELAAKPLDRALLGGLPSSCGRPETDPWPTSDAVPAA